MNKMKFNIAKRNEDDKWIEVDYIIRNDIKIIIFEINDIDIYKVGNKYYQILISVNNLGRKAIINIFNFYKIENIAFKLKSQQNRVVILNSDIRCSIEEDELIFETDDIIDLTRKNKISNIIDNI